MLSSPEATKYLDASLPSQAEKISHIFQEWFLKIREIRNGTLSLQGLVAKKIDTLTGHTQEIGDGLKRVALEKVGVYRQRALEHKERLLARVQKCNELLPLFHKKASRLRKEYEVATHTAQHISSLRVFKKTKAFVGDKMYALRNSLATKMRISETAEIAEQGEEILENIRNTAEQEHQSLHNALQEKIGNYAEEKDRIYEILGTTEEEREKISELIDGCVQKNFLSIRKMNRLLTQKGVSSRAIWGIIEPLQSSWVENMNAVDFEKSQKRSAEAIKIAEERQKMEERQKNILKKWNIAQKRGSITTSAEITLVFQTKTALNGKWEVKKVGKDEIALRKGSRYITLHKKRNQIIVRSGDEILTQWLQDITFPEGESQASSLAA